MMERSPRYSTAPWTWNWDCQSVITLTMLGSDAMVRMYIHVRVRAGIRCYGTYVHTRTCMCWDQMLWCVQFGADVLHCV